MELRISQLAWQMIIGENKSSLYENGYILMRKSKICALKTLNKNLANVRFSNKPA